MKKQAILFISFILCALGAQAEDSIKVSAADLQSLIQRVEKLEQQSAVQQTDSAKSQQIVSDEAKPQKKRTHGRFVIGGYGEVTAKHCFYSNNYLRYGQNPSRFAGDHYGEFDLPHVVIYMGYDFGKGWSVGTEIEFEHGGTESAIEIEEEEGGEYESEIERGGEVALEQFWLQKAFNRFAIIRAGMQVIPVGGLNAHHESTEYFGVYRNEGDFTMSERTPRIDRVFRRLS